MTGREHGQDSERVWTLPEVARHVRVEYRTAHVWMREGLIAPSLRETSGTGNPALFSDEDVARVLALAALRRRGLSMDGLRAALADPHGFAANMQSALDAFVRSGNGG